MDPPSQRLQDRDTACGGVIELARSSCIRGEDDDRANDSLTPNLRPRRACESLSLWGTRNSF